MALALVDEAAFRRGELVADQRVEPREQLVDAALGGHADAERACRRRGEIGLRVDDDRVWIRELGSSSARQTGASHRPDRE